MPFRAHGCGVRRRRRALGLPGGSRRSTCLIAAVVALSLCTATWSAEAQSASDQAKEAVSLRYDFESPDRRFRLPRRLEEISGLVVLPDGRLLAHEDERGIAYELDPESGNIIKTIPLGPGRVAGDFEGIAWRDGRFFLVTSGGTLVTFAEGDDDEDVAFGRIDTGLDSECEVEGLSEVPGRPHLLIACKTNLARRYWGSVRIFRFDLEARTTQLGIQVDAQSLEKAGFDELHPSGIAFHPEGRIFIVAAMERALIEMDETGRVVAATKLDRDHHRQPEGIAFLADGTLLIADEGDGRRARLTVYHPEARQ